MNRITAASRVALATAALLPALAFAGPREEVLASIKKFMAARTYHATLEHVSSSQKTVRNEMDYVAPDRYRMRIEGVGEQVLVGDTMHMNMHGRVIRLPLPKGTMTQWREPQRIAENIETMKVTALGAEVVGGVPTKKYRIDYTRPHGTTMTYWVGPDGYPVQALTVGGNGREKVTTTIRYSRFNDPAIRIAVPK